MQVTLYDPYLSASEVVFHEEALYQVYVPLPLPFAHFHVIVSVFEVSVVVKLSFTTTNDKLCLVTTLRLFKSVNKLRFKL